MTDRLREKARELVDARFNDSDQTISTADMLLETEADELANAIHSALLSERDRALEEAAEKIEQMPCGLVVAPSIDHHIAVGAKAAARGAVELVRSLKSKQ